MFSFLPVERAPSLPTHPIQKLRGKTRQKATRGLQGGEADLVEATTPGPPPPRPPCGVAPRPQTVVVHGDVASVVGASHDHTLRDVRSCQQVTRLDGPQQPQQVLGGAHAPAGTRREELDAPRRAGAVSTAAVTSVAAVEEGSEQRM
jgi:hypothetical protein